MKATIAVAVAALALAGCAPKNPEKDAALKGCTDFLRASAKNPSSAEIPAPSTHTVSGEGQFVEWKHGDGLLFMNDMGAKLDTSARCFTTSDGIIVESFYVDDKRVWETDGVRARREAEEARLAEADRAVRATRDAERRSAADAAADAAAAAAAAALE